MMKLPYSFVLAVACFAMVAAPAAAQGTSTASGATATVHRATGTVKKVDKTRGMVTFEHGPVPSLQWPSMTMDFAVAEPRVMERLKPGAKLDFSFKEETPGKYVVTDVAE